MSGNWVVPFFGCRHSHGGMRSLSGRFHSPRLSCLAWASSGYKVLSLALDPRCAASDHLCIDIEGVRIDPTDRAAVTVGILDGYCHRLAENQAGQFLLRFIAIGLFGFRTVNSANRILICWWPACSSVKVSPSLLLSNA